MNAAVEMTETDIRNALVKIGRVPEGDPDGVAAVIARLASGEMTMREAQGIPTAEVEAAYARGFGRFQAGRYEEAEKIFGYLCLLDQNVAKYWSALGACRFNLGAYAPAVVAYGMASNADPDDPKPHFRAAEAFLKSGETELGARALQASIDVAGSHAQHAGLKAKAQGLLDVINDR
ncbi:MAG: SycD/LcrH family type III secretion system chaperone [Pseudomonadota bacterium]